MDEQIQQPRPQGDHPLGDTPAPEQPQEVATPEPVRTTRWIDSWWFFWSFALCATLFWAAEVWYYYSRIPNDLTGALVNGSALAGMTLISCALFSSAIFKWIPRYAQYWRLRRFMGFAGVAMIIIHIGSFLYLVLGLNLWILFTEWNPLKNPLLFGLFAFIIFLVMFSTSTDWAMQKIGPKRWKNIHRFVYIAYPAAIFHYLLLRPDVKSNPAGILLLAVTALAVFGQLFWFFKIASRQKFRTKGAAIGFTIIALVIIIGYLAWGR